MSGEAEPRRSVRATKGQHTKSFDELELPVAPKRRQTKKTKKAQENEQAQEPEEVIRCVCGATEQDEDSGEAWISCEICYAWQHNVCVGVSSFEDEIPDNYWCERCRPDDHKELLQGIAKGEKPWETRRMAHEAEEADRKKKKGGRRGRAKKAADPKEEVEKETKAKAKATPIPTPDAKDKKETVSKQGKRKIRDESQEIDAKSSKARRVSERGNPSQSAKYAKPDDLATSIAELAAGRTGPAKALKKSIAYALGIIIKQGDFDLPGGTSEEEVSENYALQIERAVYDTHPSTKGQREYSQQIKSLTFNLKNNLEVMQGLLHGAHTPSALAVMTSEQLASAEMQRQTAEMRARAEKQSILYTQETGPRVRRTHKGEEVVEDESIVNDAPIPMAGGPRKRDADDDVDVQRRSLMKRESTVGDDTQMDVTKGRSPSQSEGPAPSPSQPNFDINKVFSKVRSPTISQNRRPSAPVVKTSGPGFDPDVDRMLEDEPDSPPYSPSEETQEPGVVWKGSLAMSSIADFEATAKHIGGANFASFGPWSSLIPKRMTVAGRIPQQSAIEYLCSLRYSSLTDIIVVSITPTSVESQQDFKALVDYFTSKNRYGVVGDKVAGNVRDTYLVPVPAGEDGHPEFMLNLVDNYIPKSRAEPMLLAVFVYRNEPDQLKQIISDEQAAAPTPQPPSATASPTPGPGSARNRSVSGPGFSPSTPQAQFPLRPHAGYTGQSTTPVPIPQPPHMQRPPVPLTPAPQELPQQPPSQVQNQPALAPPHHAPALAPPSQMTDAQKYQAQQAGQELAREILGPLVSVPTVQFLLPQAHQMSRREWEVIRTIYEKDPRARDDLQYLGQILEKEGAEKRAQSNLAAAKPS